MAAGVTALGPEVTLSEGLNPRGIGVGGSEAASSCGLFGTGTAWGFLFLAGGTRRVSYTPEE